MCVWGWLKKHMAIQTKGCDLFYWWCPLLHDDRSLSLSLPTPKSGKISAHSPPFSLCALSLSLTLTPSPFSFLPNQMERIYVTVRARPLSAEESKTSPWRISGNSISLSNVQSARFDFGAFSLSLSLPPPHPNVDFSLIFILWDVDTLSFVDRRSDFWGGLQDSGCLWSPNERNRGFGCSRIQWYGFLWFGIGFVLLLSMNCLREVFEEDCVETLSLRANVIKIWGNFPKLFVVDDKINIECRVK